MLALDVGVGVGVVLVALLLAAAYERVTSIPPSAKSIDEWPLVGATWWVLKHRADVLTELLARFKEHGVVSAGARGPRWCA